MILFVCRWYLRLMILQAELWIQAPRNGDVANILAQFFANKSRTNYSLDNIYILYKYIYTHTYIYTYNTRHEDSGRYRWEVNLDRGSTMDNGGFCAYPWVNYNDFASRPNPGRMVRIRELSQYGFILVEWITIICPVPEYPLQFLKGK